MRPSPLKTPPFWPDLQDALEECGYGISEDSEEIIYCTLGLKTEQVGYAHIDFSERETLLDFCFGTGSERFDTDLKQRLESDGHSATWVESPDCRRFDALLIRWKTGKGGKA